MDIVSSVGKALGDWLTLFTSKFTETINELTKIFYDTETGLTILGVMAVAGIAMGIIFTCFRFARGLLHM